MNIVMVHVHVKPEFIETFKEISSENARNSAQEAGIARFDIIQQADDPTRFILVEVYRTPEAPARHKETEHYKAWREKAIDMMAEPRYSMQYKEIYPLEDGW